MDARDICDLTHWWTCPHCGDRMASSTCRADVELDQGAHITALHPWDPWQPHELSISHWRIT